MKKLLFIVSIFLMAGMILTSCKKEESDGPVACFNVESVITAGVATTFNSSCSENAVSFDWDFGDGASSTDANPVHTYTADGTFSVSLTVEDDAGESDDASKSITVEAGTSMEHSGIISSDETWVEGLHLITGDVHVDGATLTIQPGAVIMFQSDKSLYIGYHSGSSGATLLANGTAAKGITFTSAAAMKSAGDWRYIWFDENASASSSMQYCVIEYGGGYSENYGEVYLREASVAMDHCTIKHSEYMGVVADGESYFNAFTNNLLEENGSYPISIYASNAHTIGSGNTITTDKGIYVRGNTLAESNAIWLKQSCAYILQGNLYVDAATSAKLTLMPGLELQMVSDASIYVGYHSGAYGTFIAEGTSSEHITITSAAPEGSRSPGDWRAIYFYQGAGSSSSFDYCDIRYGGGYSENYGSIHVVESSISLTNSTIMHSEFLGISLDSDGFFEACTDNTFEASGNYPIEIDASEAHTIGAGNTFNTGPGILVNGNTVDQAAITWLAHGVPYIMDGVTYVDSPTGTTLTIAPGSVLKFTSGSDIYVGYHSGTYGNLVADGDAGNEITFTSAAASGFESPGDWRSIWFYDGTGSGSILDHCIISYGGGYSSNTGSITIRETPAGNPTITNCQISNSEAYGIHMSDGASPTMSGNTFSNNALGDTN